MSKLSPTAHRHLLGVANNPLFTSETRSVAVINLIAAGDFGEGYEEYVRIGEDIINNISETTVRNALEVRFMNFIFMHAMNATKGDD